MTVEIVVIFSFPIVTSSCIPIKLLIATDIIEKESILVVVIDPKYPLPKKHIIASSAIIPSPIATGNDRVKRICKPRFASRKNSSFFPSWYIELSRGRKTAAIATTTALNIFIILIVPFFY